MCIKNFTLFSTLFAEFTKNRGRGIETSGSGENERTEWKTENSILRLFNRRMCAIIQIRKVRAHKGGLPSIIGGANPPDERKEGDANVCYIFGFNPDRYTHCRSRGIVLYSLREKKIAATTRNSDGC